MTNKELNEFQLKCENLLIDNLNKIGKSISNRTLGGQSETYITGTIERSDISFWIYDDGAYFKSSEKSPMFEKPDYKSLDDLANDFVQMIIKTIKKTTEHQFAHVNGGTSINK